MKEVTQFTGAIHTDNQVLFQPKGTFLYTLNSVISSKEGDTGARTNELGNIECINLDPGFKVISHKNIENKVILFITDNVTSIIGEKDEFCNFTPLIISKCLGFKTCKQIQCEFEIVNGCERVIYFVDGSNKDKAINLDALDSYLPDSITIDDANTGNKWNCELFNLTPDAKIPCSTVKALYTGGSLDLGVYQIATRYGSSNLNQNTYDVVSNVVPIINKKSGYNQTEGGTVTTVGKVAASIDIKLTNVDTNYDKITIAIIATIDGVTTAYNVITLDTDDIVTYSFRGLTASMTEIPLAEIAIDKVVYDTSKTLKIHDSRLLRGNLQEKKIDWHKFQQLANNARVFYETSANKHGDLNEFNGYKNSNLTFSKKSYLRDEVYALGVIWVFKDGSKSPVFHIPGRDKNEFPNGNQITYSQDPNGGGVPSGVLRADHSRMPVVGFSGTTTSGWDSMLTSNTSIPAIDKTFNPSATERWQIYNTAIRTNATVNSYGPNTHKGIMGYNESENFTYPDIKDCDGFPVYPTGKIRHHRMPDTTLEPHFYVDANGVEFIIELGIQLENITAPSQYQDQIQGYYIVRGERQDVNKTVLDKGIVYNNMNLKYNDVDYLHQCAGLNKHFKDVDGTTPSSNAYTSDLYTSNLPAKEAFANNTNETGIVRASETNVSFHGVVSKYTSNLVGDYLKIESSLKADKVDSYGYVREQDTGDKRMRSHEAINYTQIFNEANTPLAIEIRTNRKINDQLNLDPQNLGVSNGLPFINNAQQESFVIEADNKLPFVNIDQAGKSTVLGIPYADSSQSVTLYNDESTALYTSIKRLNVDPYSQLSSINYINASKCLETNTNVLIFNGDTFITKHSFKKTFITINRRTGTGDYNKEGDDALWVQVISMFVESEINSELRHSIDVPSTIATDETAVTTYFPKQRMEVFLRDSDINQFSDGSWDSESLGEVIHNYHEGNFAKNFYRYNFDYSKENTIKNYFSLSDNFKFCSDCLNFFPHKIVYSNKTFADSSSLEKRIFLANNETEIPNTYGAITNMFTDNDQLWIHSEKSLFKQQTKPNELQAGSSTIFLGVGEIFSIPPQQIRTIDTGYAGSKHKFATHTDEMGTYFVSADDGKIFLIQGSNLTDITLESGNRMMFNEKLPMIFEKQYKKLTGNDYECVEGTVDSKSVGFSSTYDRVNKRWLLHKKDYKIIDEASFDVNNIDFSDITKFENKSWTASFKADSFISWHSYLPDYMFNTSNELFLCKDNGIWKHNEGKFQTYFGIEYPHILEWVNNQAPTDIKIFNNIEYIQSCEKFNNVYNDWIKDINVTFDTIVAYNDTQSTGDLTLVNRTGLYDSINYNPAQALAFHKENFWRINQLRDYSIASGIPNFTHSWPLIKPTYPIDKVVNIANIDLTKSQYELARLRGKYLITRATFNNPDKDLKLNTELFNTEYEKSIR